MCRGCEAYRLTINLLRIQIDRLEEHNKVLTSKLDLVLGIDVKTPTYPDGIAGEPDSKNKLFSGKSHITWSEARTKLEVRDSKLLQELQKLDES